MSRLPCPECKSSNNLTSWEHEGNTFQRCQTSACPRNKVRIVDKEVKTQQQYIPRPPQTSSDLVVGEFRDIRGISKATCQELGIHCIQDNVIFNYNKAQKIRYPDKTFEWKNFNKNRGLFGKGGDYDKAIYITEGEFDAASLVEKGQQAYSISAGADSGAKEIEEHLEELRQYQKIIFWLDNDKPGKKALKDILLLEDLPLHKVYSIKSKAKDANEALLNTTLMSELDKAILYRPDGVIFSKNLDKDFLRQPEPHGKEIVTLPKTSQYLKGIKSGRLYLLTAGSGCGKSHLLKTIALNDLALKHPDIKIANLFLEETQKSTVNGYVAIHSGIPLADYEENPQLINDKDYDKLHDKLFNNKQMTFYDHFGSLDSKELFSLLNWLAKVEKTNVILLDHISIVVSGMESSREGERKDIDKLMTKLKNLTIETGVTIIAVVHLTRPQGALGYENGLQVSLNALRGSGSLGQLSDVVIAIERDQMNEFEKTKATIRVLKNRITGKVGITDTIYYNETTGLLSTLDNIFSSSEDI